MTAVQALNAFYSRFWTAYEETSVPKNAELPYITYQVAVGDFPDTVVLTASLWYRSTSWKAITEKEEEISDYIGTGGVILPTDDGAIWITKGTPFAQFTDDDSDSNVKRIILNLTANYLTT